MHECENVVVEMKEKFDSRPEEIGSSKSSCKEHQVHHEVFVLELQKIEERIVDIKNTSKRLKKKFPNANIFTDKLTEVNETFSLLQTWEIEKKNNSLNIMKLFDFHKQVKNQIIWIDELLIKVGRLHHKIQFPIYIYPGCPK